jgi:phage terminase small subunit
MPLYPRHQLFVEEYLVTFNAAAAARAVGYPRHRGRQSGWELLQRADVRTAVEKGFRKRLAAAKARARKAEEERNAREPGFGWETRRK